MPDYFTAVIAEEDVELNSEPTSEIDEFIDESANGGKENPNTCTKNKPFVWCVPKDYDNWKEPWRYRQLSEFPEFPWVYRFKFGIREVEKINDHKQTLTITTYFRLTWHEPRLKINKTSLEWKDTKFGSPDKVNIPPDFLSALWKPDLEVYGMEAFERKRLLKSMSSITITKDQFVEYEAQVDFKFSCQMTFHRYPLDSHKCPFRIGSYGSTNETVKCESEFQFNPTYQRSLQYFITIKQLPKKLLPKQVKTAPKTAYCYCSGGTPNIYNILCNI